MILCEIGQQRHLNARAGQALLGNANGAGFNGTVRNASRHKLSKLRLQQNRIWCGHARRHQVGGQPHAQRTHKSATGC